MRRYRPLERFTRAVEDYQRYRPDYPPALGRLIDGLRLPDRARVVDLGAGTGIATRRLQRANWNVLGLEPNRAMAQAGSAGGGSFAQGRAEQLPLGDQTVDLFTGGQCWHWFEMGSALAELERVARPGAWSLAFWNVRKQVGPWLGYEALLQQYVGGYSGAGQRPTTLERVAERLGRPLELWELWPFEDLLDWEQVLGRTRSTSNVLHGVEDREAFEADLHAWFRGEARGGRVALPYETVLGGWLVSP